MILYCILAFWSLAINAQDNSLGHFITPPATGALHDYSQNPNYQIGQSLTIEWTVAWKSVDLWLWQNDNTTPELLLQNEPNKGKLQWQIKTKRNYAAQSDVNGTVFFLQIGQANGPGAFGSHYFNLTGPNSSPSSSAASGPTNSLAVNNLIAIASPTQTSVTVTGTALPSPFATVSSGMMSFTASRAEPNTSSVSSTSNPSSSLSPSSPSASSSPQSAVESNNASNAGLAAGLGIGLGAAVAGLVGALMFILFKRRRRTQSSDVSATEARWPQGPGVMPGFGPGSTFTQQAPVEAMGGRRPTQEFFNGPTPVHEMSNDERDTGGVRIVGGVHEMPTGRSDSVARTSAEGEST